MNKVKEIKVEKINFDNDKILKELQELLKRQDEIIESKKVNPQSLDIIITV